MHIDFALPVAHDLMSGFEEWQRKAELACADYGFHMAVTRWDDKVAADMATLVQQGINSFKFFMAYKVHLCAGCISMLFCEGSTLHPEGYALWQRTSDACRQGRHGVSCLLYPGRLGYPLLHPCMQECADCRLLDQAGDPCVSLLCVKHCFT